MKSASTAIAFALTLYATTFSMAGERMEIYGFSHEIMSPRDAASGTQANGRKATAKPNNPRFAGTSSGKNPKGDVVDATVAHDDWKLDDPG